MSKHLDGMPVTSTAVQFWSEKHKATALGDMLPGKVFPVVVLVRVGPITHTPGDHDEMERVDQLEVRKLLVPDGQWAQELMEAFRTGVAPGTSGTGVSPAAIAEQAARFLASVDEFEKAGCLAWARQNVSPAEWQDALERSIRAWEGPDEPTPGSQVADLPTGAAVDAGPADAEPALTGVPIGDFQMPPTLPETEGEVTLRRVLPSSPRLRKFLSEE